MLALALVSAVLSHAQPIEGPAPAPGGGKLVFDVWDPHANKGEGAWSALAPDVKPGTPVQVRVRAEYTGTRTDLFALGEALLQPVIAGEGSPPCVGDDALIIDCVQMFVEGAHGGALMPDVSVAAATLHTFVARTCP